MDWHKGTNRVVIEASLYCQHSDLTPDGGTHGFLMLRSEDKTDETWYCPDHNDPRYPPLNRVAVRLHPMGE